MNPLEGFVGLFRVMKSRALPQLPRFEDSGPEITGSRSFSHIIFANIYSSILLECSVKISEWGVYYWEHIDPGERMAQYSKSCSSNLNYWATRCDAKVKEMSARCGTISHPAIFKRYMLKWFQAVAIINPPEFRTLRQAPCQDLLFAYKWIYTEIDTGIPDKRIWSEPNQNRICAWCLNEEETRMPGQKQSNCKEWLGTFN